MFRRDRWMQTSITFNIASYDESPHARDGRAVDDRVGVQPEMIEERVLARRQDQRPAASEGASRASVELQRSDAQDRWREWPTPAADHREQPSQHFAEVERFGDVGNHSMTEADLRPVVIIASF